MKKLELSNLKLKAVSNVLGEEKGYEVSLNVNGVEYSASIYLYPMGWFILDDLYYKTGGQRPSKFNEDKNNAIKQWIMDKLDIANDKEPKKVKEMQPEEILIGEVTEDSFTGNVLKMKNGEIYGDILFYDFNSNPTRILDFDRCKVLGIIDNINFKQNKDKRSFTIDEMEIITRIINKLQIIIDEKIPLIQK